jgi:nitrogen fixation protein FixH
MMIKKYKKEILKVEPYLGTIVPVAADIGKIESMGGTVAKNPLRASQDLNMTIANRTQKLI